MDRSSNQKSEGLGGSMDSPHTEEQGRTPVTFTQYCITAGADGSLVGFVRGKSQNGAAVKSYYESQGKAATCSQPPQLSRISSTTGTEVGLSSQSLPIASVSTQEALDSIGLWPDSQQPLPDIPASQFEEVCFGRLDDKELGLKELPSSMSRELSYFRITPEDPLWCGGASALNAAAQDSDDFLVMIPNDESQAFENNDIAALFRALDGADSGMEESGSSEDVIDVESTPTSSFGVTDGRELPKDNEGDYGFDFEIPNAKGDIIFERRKLDAFPTLFIRAKAFSVTFSFQRTPKVGTYVTTRARFTNQGRVGKEVETCKKSGCASKKAPQGWMGEDCPYLQLLKQDGETVSEETVVRFLQSKAVTAQFGICCYNSCFGAKTEIRLIFEARNSAGKIIGVRSMNVRVCAAPKRDYAERLVNIGEVKGRKKRRLQSATESEPQSDEGPDSGNTSFTDDIPKMKRMRTEEYTSYPNTAELIAAGFLDVQDSSGLKAKARLENGKICLGVELCMEDNQANVLHARHVVSSAIMAHRLGTLFKLGVPVPLSETPQNIPGGMWAVASKGSGPSQAARSTQPAAESQKSEGGKEIERLLAKCGSKIHPSVFSDAGIHTMDQLRKQKKTRIVEILSFCNTEAVEKVWKELKK
ncbi:p53 [Ramazzottius varieornatus]|uniref:p53 n=1 Tax=Ramazzottius varieornatus TaxID=947166 RepID=A0A1D1VBG3_RAMVA|nr:p53 [Ramazzottius varieornatus]